MRLITARARAQFKDTADLQDAEAIIKLHGSFIQILASDTQGRVNLNKIFGDSRETRDKIELIKDTIQELSQVPEYNKTAPIEEIKKIINIPESEFEKIIEELKKKGEIWEAKPGMLKLRQY